MRDLFIGLLEYRGDRFEFYGRRYFGRDFALIEGYRVFCWEDFSLFVDQRCQGTL